MERCNGGYLGTTQQHERIPAGRFHARRTSFTDSHVTSGLLNRIGNGKRRTGVRPAPRDREEKLHPIVARVKLATHTEMRSPEHDRQRGIRTVQSIGRDSFSPRPLAFPLQYAPLYSGNCRNAATPRKCTASAAVSPGRCGSTDCPELSLPRQSCGSRVSRRPIIPHSWMSRFAVRRDHRVHMACCALG